MLSKVITVLVLVLMVVTVMCYAAEGTQNQQQSQTTQETKLNDLAEKVSNVVDSMFTAVETALSHFFKKLLDLIKAVAKVASMALGALGVVLWSTGWSPYRGKQLMFAALILAALSFLVL
ncbi:MAG: hypothetical protein DRJ40_01230 [Thermoprotei archaeon]|nr:MAG: hypothetical protein DRJ40_01230 [Thermoprotei archaeon]